MGQSSEDWDGLEFHKAGDVIYVIPVLYCLPVYAICLILVCLAREKYIIYKSFRFMRLSPVSPLLCLLMASSI